MHRDEILDSRARRLTAVVQSGRPLVHYPIDRRRDKRSAFPPGALQGRMLTMDAFSHILHWKLTHGSHPFPGKDGGTCINEAAIVAAGFEYQPVRRVEDMPDCFSRPICRLAMGLNDGTTDKERQRLLPFVTRLACADTPEVERERAAYIQARWSYPFTFQKGLAVLEGALA